MGQYDIFLKVDGIEGEAQDAKHKNEIQLSSVALEARSGAVRSTGTAGVLHDIGFTSTINKASPKLCMACAAGTKIGKAVVTFRKSGGKQLEFLVITLSDVLVSYYAVHGQVSGENQIPTEQFTFNFAKIKYDYREQKQDGSLGGAIQTSYDVQPEAGQGQ